MSAWYNIVTISRLVRIHDETSSDNIQTAKMVLNGPSFYVSDGNIGVCSSKMLTMRYVAATNVTIQKSPVVARAQRKDLKFQILL